jgi:hypothetical protein
MIDLFQKIPVHFFIIIYDKTNCYLKDQYWSVFKVWFKPKKPTETGIIIS